MNNTREPEPIRARVPADVEAPDRVLYGLTARQLAILGAAAALAYLTFQALHEHVPTPVLLAGLMPLGGVAAMLALGRRDGLPLDRWLAAAVRHRRAPRRLVPAGDGITPPPPWAPAAGPAPVVPAGLRLPAAAIAPSGLVNLDHHTHAAAVAATTVNLGLRTADEQAALVAGYARWLNSLDAPVQIVVSPKPVDLAAHADRIADAAQMLPHPQLIEAAAGYAQFLLDLETEREPLWRTVTITHTASGTRAASDTARHAEHTAAALPAIGSSTGILDGPTLLGLLTSAADPYTYTTDHPGRALPDQPITTPGGPR